MLTAVQVESAAERDSWIESVNNVAKVTSDTKVLDIAAASHS